jgi:hypothetical protein
VPYLQVPQPDGRRSRDRGVAIAWRAGDWNPQRSLPADLARAVVADCGCSVEVLQQTLLPGEDRYFTPPPPRSITEAAQVIDRADVVVTVDTVFAHLAGALGRPVLLLLNSDADWRWMQDRDDSPWYPTARLFRQQRAGDWSEVVARVRQALSDLGVSSRRRSQSQAPPARDAVRPESPTA